MELRIDGLRHDHPTLGALLIRVFKDGTACACRVTLGKTDKERRVVDIVPSTEMGVSLDDVKRRVAAYVKAHEGKEAG